VTYRFHGTERVTWELDGTFAPDAVALPAGLSHDEVEGRGRVSLFGFAIEGLQITGVPLLRWSYAELLWRIAVRWRDRPAWWVVACDLAARGPAIAARHYVHYDVRPNVVTIDRHALTSRGAACELAVRADEADLERTPPPPSERRVVLVGREAGWRVPWGHDDSARRIGVHVRVERDSLSTATLQHPIIWRNTAILHLGRQHRCGVADRRDRATNEP